jgi:hypothetical protein
MNYNRFRPMTPAWKQRPSRKALISVPKLGGFFTLLAAIPCALFAAWLTHVIVCIKSGLWLFLIAGAIFFPVAIVHGIGIWFGAW